MSEVKNRGCVICLSVYLGRLRKWLWDISLVACYIHALSTLACAKVTKKQAYLLGSRPAVPSLAEQPPYSFSGHLSFHYSKHANTANEAVCCLLNKWMPGRRIVPASKQ